MPFRKTLLALLLLFAFVFSVHCVDNIVGNGLGQPSPLPLPSSLTLEEYEEKLYAFLEDREYEKLGWKRDKSVRNTGPFVNDQSYGVHPAVLIYYSPEVIEWLRNDRQGIIPDGAMIVKVMYAAPAQRYAHMSMEEISKLEEDPHSTLFEGWTVMVKDQKGAKDGWFWSYYAHNQPVDQIYSYPFDYPNSGFGQYCVRCHASAESEFTFSSLSNIEGEPGDPITYYVDGSWKNDAVGMDYDNSHELQARALQISEKPKDTADIYPLNASFVSTFNEMGPVPRNEVKRFPPVTLDHVVSGPNGPGQFLTSDQCLSCHDGQSGNFLPNMIEVNDDKVTNLSPFGEWRWSMMGLAGRDPIFYAQLESEKTIHNQGNLANEIQDLCFSCHGVMGQRQYHIDHGEDALFSEKQVYQHNPNEKDHIYGALAREGISCMSCHQIIDDGKSLKEIETGRFVISPPGEVHGPFENPPEHAMDEALGIKPKYSSYVKSSRLCGSCHTINLPVFNAKGEKVGMHYEQATYLEWLNSSYQDEYLPKGSMVKSCQDCHMPPQYPFGEGDSLAFKIANIQDQDYPEADHLTAASNIHLETRKDFRRHTLLGINIYGLEMFRQYDEILGVRKTDYMTGSPNGLPDAIANSNLLAKEHSVDVKIPELNYSNGKLSATVKLTNLTGHRFPSGVGFRRAFLEFKVVDAKGNILWASGRSNDVGVITDQNGQPLPSEFLERNAQGIQQYEPHYTVINSQDQVQIYQELTKNPEGEFTTSFVAIAEVVKDNRLLPLGWTKTGPEGFDPDFAEATMPHGQALDDQVYMSGKGTDMITYEVNLPKASLKGAKVVATLYYQSIPPYYLKQRFETAKGADGKRLYYLTSHLQTEDTPVKGWKLSTGKAERAIE